MNTLFDICKERKLTYKELKGGIDKFSSKINFKNEDQETALMILCMYNPKIELIKLMIQSGADVKIPNINHYLLYLFLGDKDFDIDVVEYLIELGCDIGYKIEFDNNNTILHQIISDRVFSTKKLEFLMKFKPDMINEVNDFNVSPLIYLCEFYPELELIKLFIKYGANPKYCLLYLFLSEKDFGLDVVEYLISQGSDIGYKHGYNNTILHEIITNRSFSIKKLEILMKLKPDMINEVNDFNVSPLMYLCKHYPELELIKLFIKYGADPKHLDSSKVHCLVYLFLSEKDFDIDVVEYLISQGCDIGYKIEYNKYTILNQIIICEAFSVKKLEILLKLKPDMINEVNGYSKISPLMYLCKHYPELELIKLFIKYGADPKHLDSSKINCFAYLFFSENDFDIDVIEYLISQGCDIGTKNSFYDTNMLHEIILTTTFTRKKLEILMKLKPGMINEIDKNGVTPLMYLCKYCPELELVKLFVEYGADVNSVNYKNKNCFFYLFNSQRNFDLNIAKYLISQGCKFTESIDGLSVLSLFASNLSFEKINFLARYNQKLSNKVNIKRQYFNFKDKLSFCSNQLFY